MSLRSWVWLGLFIGSTIGGFLPALWGGSLLSVAAVIASAVGGIAGIWAGYELHKRF